MLVKITKETASPLPRTFKAACLTMVGLGLFSIANGDTLIQNVGNVDAISNIIDNGSADFSTEKVRTNEGITRGIATKDSMHASLKLTHCVFRVVLVVLLGCHQNLSRFLEVGADRVAHADNIDEFGRFLEDFVSPERGLRPKGKKKKRPKPSSKIKNKDKDKPRKVKNEPSPTKMRECIEKVLLNARMKQTTKKNTKKKKPNKKPNKKKTNKKPNNKKGKNRKGKIQSTGTRHLMEEDGHSEEVREPMEASSDMKEFIDSYIDIDSDDIEYDDDDYCEGDNCEDDEDGESEYGYEDDFDNLPSFFGDYDDVSRGLKKSCSAGEISPETDTKVRATRHSPFLHACFDVRLGLFFSENSNKNKNKYD